MYYHPVDIGEHIVIIRLKPVISRAETFDDGQWLSTGNRHSGCNVSLGKSTAEMLRVGHRR